MKTNLAAFLLSALFVPGLAFADPWKDESGHGRYRDWNGETPGWARGRGYWDGHFRRALWPPAYWHGYAAPAYEWYAPPPVLFYDEDYLKDQREAEKEWRKEMREQEKEARERWRDYYWR